eukprot:15445822-Alexandrium_andersonii.AAC.1
MRASAGAATRRHSTTLHLLTAESSPGADLMPLREGRQLKPEYAGYTRVQVAVDSGAAASAMPGRLLGSRKILESEASREG